MRITPINSAEAIFEPFWDPALSGLAAWRVDPGEAHGLEVRQNWCWASFSWVRRPASGPALRMARSLDLDVADYDRLMVSLTAPERAVFRMTADTDAGRREFVSPPSPPGRKEYLLDLGGARKVLGLSLAIDAAEDGIASGWINWIGLQSCARLPAERKLWRARTTGWEDYLQPAGFVPRFQPRYGLLLDAADLEELRTEHAALLSADGETPFTKAARRAGERAPEDMVGEFVNFWTDTRYCRERDDGNLLLQRGPEAAVAALILRDADLLRLAARYALAIAFSGTWDDGMICAFPGSSFEHRCFVQSLCAQETAAILDLAGEMFTDLGRDLILRRLAEDAAGSINYNVWKHEYIHHCNQLAWFSPGRMIAYALMERHWPRVKPYRELAYRDLVASLEDTVLPDGGYVEGPSYFRCVARDGGLSFYYYARAEGTDFQAVIPESMKRTGAFAEAVCSTDDAQDVIPLCDARDRMEQESLAVMARALPGSRWEAMLRKSLARTGGMADTAFGWSLSRAALRADAGPVRPPEPFVFLPVMGVMASTRAWEGTWVKLLLMGNKAGAGHTHEDKGSFVLEFAGETFCMDPGTCDYSSPFADIVKHCERHAMLVPYGVPERPHPACPIPVDVKPAGRGDGLRFSATLDASAGWEGYFSRWVRSWDSPHPGELSIRDEWSLVRGEGVEFLWITGRPVSQDRDGIRIIGARGTVTLTPPQGCSVHLDDLPLFGGEVQRRIRFRLPGTSGTLFVRAALERRPHDSTPPSLYDRRMKKGINYWAFPSDKDGAPHDVLKALRRAKELGYDCFELTLEEKGFISLSTTQKDAEMIRKEADGLGLCLKTLASGFAWGTSPTHPDKEVRRKALTLYERMLEIAHWLGVETILYLPGMVSAPFLPAFPPQPYEAVWERATECVKKLLPKAERFQVRLGIENVWNRFLLSPLEMREFIDSFGSPLVGSYFDVGNVMLFGHPEHWVSILGKRIQAVHLKDFRVNAGNLDGFVDLLSGDVDWKAVMGALGRIGYDGPITAEIVPGRLGAAEKAIAAMRFIEGME